MLRATVVKGSPLWLEKQTSCLEGSHLVVLFDSIAGLCFHKRDYFLSLYNHCVYLHFPCPALHVNNWQNRFHHTMETSSKTFESLWDREITSIYLTPKIQDLKYRINMYRCADEKISKTENKVTAANFDVENLDHQNWQLLEVSLIYRLFNKQKIS